MTSNSHMPVIGTINTGDFLEQIVPYGSHRFIHSVHLLAHSVSEAAE